MLSTWPKDGHRLSVSCMPLHLCSCSRWVLSGSRSIPWPVWFSDEGTAVMQCGLGNLLIVNILLTTCKLLHAGDVNRQNVYPKVQAQNPCGTNALRSHTPQNLCGTSPTRPTRFRRLCFQMSVPIACLLNRIVKIDSDPQCFFFHKSVTEYNHYNTKHGDSNRSKMNNFSE